MTKEKRRPGKVKAKLAAWLLTYLKSLLALEVDAYLKVNLKWQVLLGGIGPNQADLLGS